jgi:hypothetical protein
MAVIVVPLVFEMDSMLALWLGATNVPAQTPIFTILVLADSLVCMFNMPCSIVAHAVGSLRNYILLPSAIGIMLLPSAWWCLHRGMPATWVFTLTILFSVLQQAASLLLLHHIFPFRLGRYLMVVLFPCLLFLALSGIVPILFCSLLEPSLPRLIATVCTSWVASTVIALLVVVRPSERSVLMAFVRQRVAGGNFGLSAHQSRKR